MQINTLLKEGDTWLLMYQGQMWQMTKDIVEEPKLLWFITQPLLSLIGMTSLLGPNYPLQTNSQILTPVDPGEQMTMPIIMMPNETTSFLKL